MAPTTKMPTEPQGDMPAHILVVDDDRRLRDLLSTFLRDNGFHVTSARDAADARNKLASISFDLLIVDVMMPGETGFDLTRDLRRTSDLPILMLTAMGDVENRLEGLSSGVDDYLAKPFEPRELVMRAKAILRRARQPAPEPAARLRFGALSYDTGRGELADDSGPVRLTTAESRLLALLAAHPGEAVSRDDLSDAGADAQGLRAVDVQVTRLRRKIEPDPREPRYLQTVRGKGYMLRPD